MAFLATLLGVVLILVALRDVFNEILQPEGSGVVSGTPTRLT